MRDLEKQIAIWRKTITPALRPDAAEELEQHLREEIDRLLAGGAPAQDAFKQAVAKLGSPHALAAEFDKLGAHLPMKWKPATIAQWTCLAVALIVAALLLPRIGHGRMTLLLASHVLAVVTGYVMMFVVGGLGICHLIGNWLGKSGSGQRHAFERATVRLATIAGALTVAGTILGMFWAKENWGRYWAWDPKEVGAVLVIACAGAIGAMRRVSRNQNAIAFASVIGNIATAWAWFGTVGTVNRDGLIIGTVNASPLLIAFTASQGILLAATLLTVKRHASTESA